MAVVEPGRVCMARSRVHEKLGMPSVGSRPDRIPKMQSKRIHADMLDAQEARMTVRCELHAHLRKHNTPMRACV